MARNKNDGASAVRGTADRKLLARLRKAGDPERAAGMAAFFRTGPGEYGEGDRFLGVVTPVMREAVRDFRGKIDLAGLRRLLAEPWNEVRAAALVLLVREAESAARASDTARLNEIEVFYDSQLDRVNNWNLVDISAAALMGACWTGRGDRPAAIRRRLDAWAGSGELWRERVAMVSTHALIRRGELRETFRLAARFRGHPHDLIHKAAGWMLREAGKKDVDALRAFLERYTPELPRTTLRYAIERLDAAERRRWLAIPRPRKRHN